MVLKNCIICYKSFNVTANHKCCSKECQRINRNKNANKEYYEKDINNKNKEERSKYKKEWYKKNKERVLENRKKYYKNNKNKCLAISKLCYQKNKIKHNKTKREYFLKNKKHLLNYLYKYKRNRLDNDIEYKLHELCRKRIRNFLKLRNYNKQHKTLTMVGCTPQELKEHLEKQFVDNMSWTNRSEWHIDHILPLSSASNQEELFKLCHYSNLQPLWAIDNIKKSNKILN